VLFTGEIRQYLLDAKPKVYLFSGLDSDSGLNVEEPSASYFEGLAVDRSVLWTVISNLRAVKTPDEIEILRYVCRVTSDA
jgi:Xaa-Pro dipeptidase